MNRSKWVWAMAVAMVPAIARGSDRVDLATIDRTIVRQPTYVSKRPYFGLTVVGSKADMRLWMVLDKEKPSDAGHRVLYVDLNGNGDLTEEGERFLGTDTAGNFVFQLPDFSDSAGNKHTHFKVRASRAETPIVMISMNWNDGQRMGGGYPEDPATDYMPFAANPAEAPVVWANGEGPFRFQHWMSGKLTIGQSDDFRVFLGHQGSGKNTFWTFSGHVLAPNEAVQATLVYRDAQGKERKAASYLKERC